jgi:Bacteriocin-protection, YdeI or OmpD-Associated
MATTGAGIESVRHSEAVEVALCSSGGSMGVVTRWTADTSSRLHARGAHAAILYRLQDAKKPKMRTRRLAKFVAMLEAGETAYP